MSAYGHELARARAQNRVLHDVLPRRRGKAVGQPGTGVNRRSLAVIPECGGFTCSDARALVVYHYFLRPAGRLKPKQVEFKQAGEEHLFLVSIDGETRRSCRCERILKLIDWYFECWFDKKVLTPSERVESLDSARVTAADIDLIASVVEGRL